MSDTRTEFAVRLTWPDGHSEISEQNSRAVAISTVNVNSGKSDGRTATLVSRTVTTTDWAEV